MKKLFLKTSLYIVLILVFIELAIRALHLYTEDPPRFIDEFGVEKRVPGHTGYAVTGNRNQNYSKFNINKSGYNSYQEYLPTADNFEIAFVGDSFIEGFHQDYYDSTGKKIEDLIPNAKVYEYGYAGYDMANQMHLIYTYKDQFDLIDKIIIYLNYEDDLDRGVYEPNYDRIKMLKSTPFKIRDNIKILAYGSKIGILEPLKRLVAGKNNDETIQEKKSDTTKLEGEQEKFDKVEDLEKISNFESLMKSYGFNKSKTAFLLDSRTTSPRFLEYLDKNYISYIDFAENFEKSKAYPILIYDFHWNNHGRDIIAKTIADYISSQKKEIIIR